MNNYFIFGRQDYWQMGVTFFITLAFMGLILGYDGENDLYSDWKTWFW